LSTYLDGAANFPFPTAAGVINGINGAATFPFPTAVGELSLGLSLDGAASFPFPTCEAVLNQYYEGAVSFPFPTCEAALSIGVGFTGAANFPFPTASGAMGQGWIGAASFPFPTASGILAASIPQMAGAASFPFPTAIGLLGFGNPATFTVMAMNLKNRLVSFYENYNFNSVALVNGVYLGADLATGIYILSGASDNGADIDASILLGNYDFGIDNIKTNPQIFLNYSGDGGLQVSLATDGDEMEGPYEVPAPHETKTQTKRANLPQGARGSHYQYLIENVYGSQVTLQNSELQFQKSQRRLH
jgi:hypothetical protein